MESAELLYKVNLKKLEIKSQLKGVYFTKPRLVACYEDDYSILKPAKKIFYFKKPKREDYPIDLNDGYSTYVKREKKCISGALQCTLEYVMSPSGQSNVDNIDGIKVFTRRGFLVKLMSFYYSDKPPKTTLRVSRYDGNLYMVHLDDFELDELQPKHTHHEQLLRNVFKESVFSNDTTKFIQPVDENKRLLVVHQSSLGKFELIYHGEVHGIQAEKEIKHFDAETLNNCRFVMAKQMWSSLRKNYSKNFTYWLQGHLANVSDFYFAYKNRAGIVREPLIHKLPSELVKEFKFKPEMCTELLYEFLQRVNDLLTNDNINSLNIVYEIDYDTETKTFTYKIFKENTEKVFITPEYVEYCKQL